MKKTKMEKGITLIALIITIVILLILAVVTIGSIRESKIIGHAKNASDEYTIAQEKEQIQLALSEWQVQKNAPGNTQTFKNVIETELNDSATVGGENNGPLTITFTKTGNVYKVTNDGNTTSFGKVTSLEKYILGKNLEGRNYSEIFNIYEDENEDTKITIIADEEFGINEGDITIVTIDLKGEEFPFESVFESGNEVYACFYIEFENIIYKVAISMNDNTTKKLVKIIEKEKEKNVVFIDCYEMGMLYSYFKYDNCIYKITENDLFEEGATKICDLSKHVGKKVSYDNKLWTILYDDNENGLQMICDEVFSYNNEKFYLGVNDSLIDWSTATYVELDNFSRFGRYLYSYNRAIETLNTACASVVTANDNIIDVRCVGSNPTNKNAENTTLYTSEKLAKWPTDNPGVFNNKAYSSDNNYIFDYERMRILDITIGYDNNNTACDYWLASRNGHDGEAGVYFEIYCVADSGRVSSPYMCEMQSGGFPSGNNPGASNYLRPVVKLKSDVQFSGSGTEADPYTFAE